MTLFVPYESRTCIRSSLSIQQETKSGYNRLQDPSETQWYTYMHSLSQFSYKLIEPLAQLSQ